LIDVLSVVIATRDRPERLRSCVASLERIAVPAGWGVEVIVVNNGGRDVAEDVPSAGHDRLHVRILTEPRRGKARAVNTGVAAARGSIVAFLDDDVTVEAEWAAEIVAEFRRDPALGLLGGRVRNADGAARGVATSLHDRPVDIVATDLLEGLAAGCNLAVRADVIAAVRGRDTRLGPGRGLAYEDIDFIRRVLRAGFRGRFSPGPVVVHRPGPRNRSVEYPRGRGAYYLKFILLGDVTVARHAWWEVCGLVRHLWRPAGERRRAAIRTGWDLAVGAAIMLGRLLRSTR
jgi:GT2 family glycosyltransferase